MGAGASDCSGKVISGGLGFCMVAEGGGVRREWMRGWDGRESGGDEGRDRGGGWGGS